MTKTLNCISAREAVNLIPDNATIVIQGSTSVPTVLLDALTGRAREGGVHGLHLIAGFGILPNQAPWATEDLMHAMHAETIFVPNWLRDAQRAGVADTIPCFLGEVPGLFRDHTVPVDVTLLNVSEPDAEGYCSFGISADIAFSGQECSRIILAQVNKYMPRTFGDPVIHVSRITAAVRADVPLVEVPTPTISPDDRKIGQFIAEQIPNGACLQIGVGGIPNAVLDALHGHQHLGVHTEAITDGLLPLIQEGIIDNSQKTILPGKTVGSLVLGSRALYDHLDNNPDFVIKDVAWTNDPRIISQNRRAMAINSAVEVDLTGQICADSIGDTIISGVGGQHDFMYGASLSEGGKCFIALPSRTAKGRSKIVPHLAPGAGVVTTRFQAQYIVTEWGIAYLRGKTTAARAKELIRIAHPDDREALERAAFERFGPGFLYVK